MFSKAKESKERYEISSNKEYIETKINECVINKMGNPTLKDIEEYLQEDVNITNIEIKEEDKEIYVVIEGYKFKIDENRNVEYVTMVDNVSVKLEKEIQEYLGENKVSVLIKASSDEKITKFEIIDPDGTVLEIYSEVLTTIGKDVELELDKEYKIQLTINDIIYTKKIMIKFDDLLPIIENVTKEVGINYAKISVQIKNKNDAKLTYKIRKDTETEYMKIIENTTELEERFEELEVNSKYIITIEASNEYGKSDKTVEVNMMEVGNEHYYINNGITNEEKLGEMKKFMANTNQTRIDLLDGYILLNCSYGNNMLGMNFSKKIDVTNINNIVANVGLNGNGDWYTNYIYIGLSSVESNTINDFVKYDVRSNMIIEKQKYSMAIDVSDLEGEYYLKIVAVHGDEEIAWTTYAEIYDVLGIIE